MIARHSDLSAAEYLEGIRSGMRCWKHETDARLVRMVSRGGAKLACWQCQICGNSTVVKRSFVQNYDDLPEYDHTIRERRMHEELAISRAESEAELAERRERYAEYLKTDKWRAKRDAVLKRDNWLCQACLTRRAEQAHHTTYAHIFDEPLFELVAICIPCHEKITSYDRERWAAVYSRKDR